MSRKFNDKENRYNARKIAKRTAAVSLAALLAGSLAAGTAAYAQSNNTGKATLLRTETTGEVAKGGLDVSEIVEEAMPSVVTITTLSVQEMQNYYGLFGFGGYAPRQEQEVEGGGSGIIIGKNDEDLLIVTNYHVIEDADKVTIGFTDSSAYDAEVQGYDIVKDLAVVSVKLDDLSDETVKAISIARIGSSDDLKVGEQVVAIGNALGYGESVTTGIVSAKNRQMNNSTNKITSNSSSGVNLIQTDAAINPGNSGGALLNMNGEVVGINSAKTASTYVEGMGYAIAISDVTDTLEKLMSFTSKEMLGEDEHGALGVSVFDVSEQDSVRYGFPMGAYVNDVTEGGAADEAGLPAGSIIVGFDGFDVSCVSDLLSYISYYAPGETVDVDVMIREGDEFTEETYQVTLAEQQKEDKAEKEAADDEEELSDGEEPEDDETETEDKEAEDKEAEDKETEDKEEEDTRSREEIFKEWDNRNF